MEFLKLSGLSDLQLNGAIELQNSLNFKITESGKEFCFTRSDGDIVIEWDGEKGKVSYALPHHVSRCIGLIVENLQNGTDAFEIHESPCYSVLGTMLDCSRNAVLNFESFKELTRRLALMGYSMIQLYTEDTFEMKEYPYFGYMRGRFTKDDIREMDSYVKLFGMELTPCIQTLAHLGTTLRWDTYNDIKDVDDILLVDEPKTYEFIECMFKTMADCFTSRRINVGLDEAHMVGLGKYLDKHGFENRFSILMRHLNKVFEIAAKYGFRPMMWSDMFFRPLNEKGSYYYTDKPIDKIVVENFPDNVDLIYWDYYNFDEKKIDGMFSRHHEITDNIVFAPGAWKWSGFSPNNHFAELTCRAQHKQCKKHNVTDVIVTAWGDNGALASAFSVLPNFLLWAELCYRNNSDDIKRRFKTCADGDYDDFMNLDMPNIVEDNNAPHMGINPSLYLLYQDSLLGLFDKHILPSYQPHFASCAALFDELAEKNSRWRYIFETQRDLCRILELKCNLGLDLCKAYKENDRAEMAEIADSIIPEILTRFKKFHSTVTEQWDTENRIFGMDSLDIKLAGVIMRLEVAKCRIDGYLNGDIKKLDELECERLPFRSTNTLGKTAVFCNCWVDNITASVLS